MAHQDVDEVTVNGHTFLGNISADNMLFLAAAADLMMILPADDVGLAGAEAGQGRTLCCSRTSHQAATAEGECVPKKKPRSAALLDNMNHLSDQCEVRPLRHDSSESHEIFFFTFLNVKHSAHVNSRSKCGCLSGTVRSHYNMLAAQFVRSDKRIFHVSRPWLRGKQHDESCTETKQKSGRFIAIRLKT